MTLGVPAPASTELWLWAVQYVLLGRKTHIVVGRDSPAPVAWATLQSSYETLIV